MTASTTRHAGFTFIELMLATLFLGTMLVAASSAIGSAAVTKEHGRTVPQTALDFAQEIHAASMLLPRAPGAGVAATSGAGVSILEDLDGAVFSPPIDAGRQAFAGSTRWTQRVALERVLVADPSTTAPVPDEEVGEEEAPWIYVLIVTMELDGAPQGSYSWWIRP